MTESKPADVHETVQGMLPWYINGTLEASDRQLVQTHLEGCSRCRAELDAHQAICDAVVDDGTTPIISLPSLDVTVQSKPTGRSSGKFVTRILPLAAGIAGAAIAASLLLMGQPDEGSINQQYETLTSSGVTNGIDLVLEIQFAEDLSTDTQEQLLIDLGASDIASTGRMNEYRFTLQGQPASLDHINSIAEDLQGQPSIQSARIVALQLPIQ